ncbi:MAG TPA: 50S ribosomal protein L21 [Candidatus Saccharimonadales bacterium]|nr:50S ribosomal protein L21 [Candidatus Saccharimonadales bacterium]
MKYAILQTGGKQYKVSEGSEIEVDKLDILADSDYKFDKVLLFANDGVIQVGQPHLDGAIITAKVLEQKKGKKIRVAKFKAKARYRKVTGHRQMLTKLQILKIAMSESKETNKSDKVKSVSRNSKI